MSRKRILVTRRMPVPTTDRLARDYDAALNADDVRMDGDAIVAAAEGVDGLLVCATERLGPEVIARLPASVGIVATYSVGHEHIDLDAARARGLVVTNTPDVLTDATAEIAFLLILAASRRAGEGERILRAGRWTGWSTDFLVGPQVTGKRLGIVGMGRIGCAVARMARGFAMEVHYHNRRRLPAEQEQGAIHHERLDDLLAVADVLSLHAPATPETENLLDAAAIARLPQNAVVVNTARGTLVDDDALIAALRSGRIAAAGLDVFRGEPNLDPRYLELDNAVLLPHMGSSTHETRAAMGDRALDNLDAFFAGREPPDRVA